MELKYKLLTNGSGVLVSRQPGTVKKTIEFSFSDLGKVTTAIFETVKNSETSTYYRELSDGKCSLDISDISGTVKVVAAHLGGARTTRYICEELQLTKLSSGEILVAPNDMNLPGTVTQIRIELDEIRKGVSDILKKYEELEDSLEKIMEGYDVT